MIGQVNVITTSKNGANIIKIGNDWYFPGNRDISDLKVGDKIDFESKVFGKDGQKGLESWTILPKPAETPAADDVRQLREVLILLAGALNNYLRK